MDLDDLDFDEDPDCELNALFPDDVRCAQQWSHSARPPLVRRCFFLYKNCRYVGLCSKGVYIRRANLVNQSKGKGHRTTVGKISDQI